MTQEQRLNYRCERTYEILADNLRDAQKRNGLTNANLAEFLHTGCGTVTKLLYQRPVRISVETFGLMLEFAGLELKPKGGERNGNV